MTRSIIEQRIDAPDRFQRNRRNGSGVLAPSRIRRDVGEHEELPAGLDHPNAIDGLRFTVAVPFPGATRALPRRRTKEFD
jgi:hypothetical protein